MNKKQKMIKSMWGNYLHNCKCRNEVPIYSYRYFKFAYINLKFQDLYKVKEWYKSVRIHD